MTLDTLAYAKIDSSTFTKEVSKEDVVVDAKQINDPAFEIGCLEAQISDLKLGAEINPESQKEVDDLVANYEQAILILKS